VKIVISGSTITITIMKKLITDIKISLSQFRKRAEKFVTDENVDQDDCFEIIREIDHFYDILTEMNMKYIEEKVEIKNLPQPVRKRRQTHFSDIITDEIDQDLNDNSSDILKKFENFGFKSVQLALVKHGKVPEFQIKNFDIPLTFKNDCIQKAQDIHNGIVIPEMVVLESHILKVICSCLMNINIEERNKRDLIICYWYKIPLIGIIIMGKSLLSLESHPILITSENNVV
jgi:hypothetical protein